MYVCMYGYMYELYVCTYVCTYVRMYVCMYMYNCNILSSTATSVKNLHYLSVIKGPPLTITTVDLLVPPAFSSLTTLSLTHTRMSPQAVVKFIGQLTRSYHMITM